MTRTKYTGGMPTRSDDGPAASTSSGDRTLKRYDLDLRTLRMCRDLVNGQRILALRDGRSVIDLSEAIAELNAMIEKVEAQRARRKRAKR